MPRVPYGKRRRLPAPEKSPHGRKFDCVSSVTYCRGVELQGAFALSRDCRRARVSTSESTVAGRSRAAVRRRAVRILTTMSGGEAGRASGAGTILQAEQTQIEEPFAPPADDLSRDVQCRADGLVVESLGGEQHDLGSDHLIIRCRISARDTFQLPLLGGRENNLVGAPSRHSETESRKPQRSQPNIRPGIYELQVLEPGAAGPAACGPVPGPRSVPAPDPT